MATQRLITMKPAFLAGIQALQPKEVQQVLSKIELLCQDPLAVYWMEYEVEIV